MEDEKSSKSDNKQFRLKFLISVLVLLLIVITIFILIFIEQNKPDRASAAVIRMAAARQLNKDPNELTDADLANIKTLMISSQELCDIKLLEKFNNLEEIVFFLVRFPEKAIPRWIKILGKFGIIDINERSVIDLKPLGKLKNLKMIDFMVAPVINFEPLSKLENLEILSIYSTNNPDVESLKKLNNIKTLYLNNQNITDKQIEGLQKALPEVDVVKGLRFNIEDFKSSI